MSVYYFMFFHYEQVNRLGVSMGISFWDFWQCVLAAWDVHIK